jgi:hypothetical protein
LSQLSGFNTPDYEMASLNIASGKMQRSIVSSTQVIRKASSFLNLIAKYVLQDF